MVNIPRERSHLIWPWENNEWIEKPHETVSFTRAQPVVNNKRVTSRREIPFAMEFNQEEGHVGKKIGPRKKVSE